MRPGECAARRGLGKREISHARTAAFRRSEGTRKRSDATPRACKLDRQRLGGGVDALVGEPERAEVHRHAVFGGQREMRLHGFVRVHVLLAHEPARFVGSDGQEGDGGRA